MLYYVFSLNTHRHEVYFSVETQSNWKWYLVPFNKMVLLSNTKQYLDGFKK